MRKLAVSLILFALALPAQKFEFWPGAQYDPAIPTVDKVLGYAAGTRIAPHADLIRYFEALQASAPSRMKLTEYAKSWEGRKLVYAILASEENLKKLPEIQAQQKKLADPRKTSEAEAKKIMASLPTILNLSYGVHGNEISSPDAAMVLAYHLLAARGDAVVDALLKDVIILIDPIQNPDGRDRFIHNFRQNEGLIPDEFPLAAERAEPWPGGRPNHYNFDMNRDWHALTQPETLGRVRFLREWFPHIMVDLHEMGGNSTYFFTPGSLPMNPNLTQEQKDQMALFGKNNAKYFDKFGWPYFTREVFDEFYPGYGASWPWFHGGMGMTYENASVRGLVLRKSDDTLYAYPESVQKHFVASLATCETAHLHRAQLLNNFYRYQATAVEAGKAGAVKEYVLARRGDVSAVDKLAHLLAEQAIEIRQSAAPFQVNGAEVPAGSYAISLAQPRNRFIHVLLDKENPMEKDFLAEQERRRKKKLPDEIYDVTGWSLPLLYNVECLASNAPLSGAFSPISGPYKPSFAVPAKAGVAYLIPWGTQAAGRFLTAALRADLKVLSGTKPFTQNGRKYPAGTLIVMVHQNPASVHDKVRDIAAHTGAEVVPAASSWVDDGINFGSNQVSPVKKAAIAMLWDTPTSSASAGQTRFVLERQYGYPVTVIRTANLAMADLSKFNVVILPEAGGQGGGYANAINPMALDRLKAWVRNGGVLIGAGPQATAWLASTQAGLLASQVEGLAKETPAAAGAPGARPAGPAAAPAAPAAAPATPGAPGAPTPGKLLAKLEDLDKAVTPDTEMPDPVAGVIVKAKVDPEYWVTSGLPETLNVLIEGRNIFAPLKRDKGINPVVYLGPDELLQSGYLWEPNRKQLAFKPFVMVQPDGRGAVVGFTGDPNFRAFMDGLNVVFLNSIFRFPGQAARGGAEE